MKFTHMMMVAAAPFVLAACGGQGDAPTPSVPADQPVVEETFPDGEDAEYSWDEDDIAETVDRDSAAWRARGNEPGWLLTVEGGQLTFTYNYGEDTFTSVAPPAVETANGVTYTADDGALVATVTDSICHDDMSGMPYPSAVTVTLADGGTFRGCGGEPETLLEGGEWKVDRLNTDALVEGGEITLAFDTSGKRVGGKGSCNTYGADYTLTGEGISFGEVMTTEMACAEPIMQQEQAFHTALKSVTNFVIEEDGALLLTNHNDAEIRARR